MFPVMLLPALPFFSHSSTVFELFLRCTCTLRLVLPDDIATIAVLKLFLDVVVLVVIFSMLLLPRLLVLLLLDLLLLLLAVRGCLKGRKLVVAGISGMKLFSMVCLYACKLEKKREEEARTGGLFLLVLFIENRCHF